MGKYLDKDGIKKLWTAIKDIVSKKQDSFNIGYGLELKDNNLNVTLDNKIFKIVDNLNLPPTIKDENKIHLIKSSKSDTNNIYEEYIYVDNNWELIGTTNLNDNVQILQSGTGITIADNKINHTNSVTAGTKGSTTTSTASANAGSVTVLVGIEYDSEGHIKTVYTRNITLNNTTYNDATTSNSGLLSSTDKDRLNKLWEAFGSALNNTIITSNT